MQRLVLAESGARHRELTLVRRESLDVVAQARQPRERRAEPDSDLQQAAGRAREPLEEQRR